MYNDYGHMLIYYVDLFKLVLVSLGIKVFYHYRKLQGFRNFILLDRKAYLSKEVDNMI